MDATRRRLLIALAASAWATDTAESADAVEAAAKLAHIAHDICQSRESADLDPFLALWPGIEAVAQQNPPRIAPGLRWLPTLLTASPPFCLPFVTALAAASGELEWRRSYDERSVSERFWNNYCWTEIFGHLGNLRSEHLSCGALVLGAGVHYPSHRHEADEIYIPLVGSALWLEQGEWRSLAPGTVIHHSRNQVHAMRTLADPLLALYLWKSDNLDQKSALVGRH